MGVFHRFLGPDPKAAQAAPPPPAPAGVPAAGSDVETATVRQIVARLEAMQPCATSS